MLEPATTDEVLRPGDMVDVIFKIVGNNETLLGLAIHSIKQTVAADERFDYQSGWRESRVDEMGITDEYLIVRVMVRKKPRQGYDQPRVQEAGMELGLVLGLMSGAVIAYSASLIIDSVVSHERTEVIERIATDPNISDVVKVASIEGATKPHELRITGGASYIPWLVGGGILAGMWFVGKSR